MSERTADIVDGVESHIEEALALANSGEAEVEAASIEEAAPKETVPVAAEEPPAGFRDLPFIGSRPPGYSPDPLRLPLTEKTRTDVVIPDIALDGAHYGSLVVRGVSVKGDSHRYQGEQRQDAMSLSRIGEGRDELLFLAVADGVGSAAKSHLGSHRACRLASLEVEKSQAVLWAALRAEDREALDRELGRVVAQVSRDLVRYADPGSPKAYATTLRCLLVPTSPEHRERVFFAVGDGGFFRARTESWQNLEGPVGGLSPDGVIDTRTAALPSEDPKVEVQLLKTEPGDVLMICTDGLSGPMNDPQVQGFLAQEWAFGRIPGLTEFLWQSQVRAKSYDDDRSVICLWEVRP
ncbi:protein phosphatase 2C domain-containing protein [Streptomyces sp. 5.8]|uniref:protein phosphatase 2C domain-containing protein n=1 Tax=Streptomyces sp. 5.8 TaxID=3406571 RepID=UPI003BB62E01